MVLTETQIAKVKEVYTHWQSVDSLLYKDEPEFCRSASISEVIDNNYSLAPSKYIEFIDHDLDIDYQAEMLRVQNEMKEVMKDEKESQQMLLEAFRGIGYAID